MTKLSPSAHAFAYAQARDAAGARVVLFGADTTNAGFSQSFLGQNYRTRTLRSPEFIRQAHNESPTLPYHFKLGNQLFDAGNLEIPEGSAEAQIEAVEKQFQTVWTSGKIPICLGGDHLVKHGALDALTGLHPDTLIVYIDAHPDTVMKIERNYETVLHHALLSEKLNPEQIVILGLRQVTATEAEGLQHWGPRVIDARAFATQSLATIYETMSAKKFQNIYFSIDLDGLNPNDAPAVEAPYPGGPSLHQLIDLIHRAANDFRIIGADITEFIPDHDSRKLTAMTAARLVMELTSCVS